MLDRVSFVVKFEKYHVIHQFVSYLHNERDIILWGIITTEQDVFIEEKRMVLPKYDVYVYIFIRTRCT